MTDNEIKKVLEHEIELAKDVGDNVAYTVEMSVLTNAIDLINRKEEMLNSAINGQETLQEYIAKQDKEIERLKAVNKLIDLNHKKALAEIERLNKENQLLLDNHPSQTHRNCVVIDNGVIYTKTLEDYENLIGDISKEGIKEFAERFKKIAGIYQKDTYVIGVDEFDNLLKEMVGEK